MKYVSCFGRLWKLSERSYRRMLRDIVKDKQTDLDGYGKCLGDIHNVTDIKPTEAQDVLDDLKSGRGRRP